ncbi:enoyl-CoA hydratase/isomerase family protein [Paraburkholderia diazotrophica]|uniref:enoyl-CoA hydratase/isomerase family protein n=1 Tax=Paraburkholderia diazotrophica TaxID=667676 RepID=UPI003D16C379
MSIAYSEYQHLKFDRPSPGVLLVTINRPEKYNATDERLHWELSKVWLTIGDDPETRAIVITGAGKAFCAGGDLDMVKRNLEDYWGVLRTGQEALDIVNNMMNLEKPIISAINGVAVGAGLAAALTADISIISDQARLSDGHTRLGVASGDHAVMLWPLMCGMAKAKYHLLLADFIDGPEAERIGLVSLCVPHAQLLDRALAVADTLSKGSQLSIRWTKRALNHWYKPVAPIFDLSVAMEMLNFVDEDAREGMQSVKEKRGARFPSSERGTYQEAGWGSKNRILKSGE